MPLCTAESPKPTWNISGSKNGMAPMPVRNSIIADSATPKHGRRISDRSSSGAGCRRACSRYPTTATRPTPIIASVVLRGTTPRPAVSNPNISPHNATPQSTSPNPSNRPRGGSRTSSTNRLTSTMPRIPIGTLMSKIQRQEKYVTMKPPTGGPITGPSSAGTVSHAIAATSSCLAAVRSSTKRPTGTIIAPPMPCRMRDTTKNHSVSARPHKTEPMVNTAIAARNTVRVP